MRESGNKVWSGTVTGFALIRSIPATRIPLRISRFGFFRRAKRRSVSSMRRGRGRLRAAHAFLGADAAGAIPRRCLYDGYERNDFLLRSTAVATPSERRWSGSAEGWAGGERVIPLCDTNRAATRGSSHACRHLPARGGRSGAGRYRGIGERRARRSVRDRPAGARGGRRAHIPAEAAVSEGDWARALARLHDDASSQPLASGRQRAEAAVRLQTAIRQALGTGRFAYTHAI
jgi:hypothetical protein